jgi:hypothetical protein
MVVITALVRIDDRHGSVGEIVHASVGWIDKDASLCLRPPGGNTALVRYR